MNDLSVKDALDKYRTQVSILKKGYAQEKYRIDQIGRSSLGGKIVREVTSVDIATYRDQRLSWSFDKRFANPVCGTKRRDQVRGLRRTSLCRLDA